MTGLAVSVVIVSRGRPTELTRCLTAVSQLQYAPFEVVVVADRSGLAAVAGMPFADALKTVRYDEPNISAARNIGIDQAAGDIVAFIDDDAVPEPTWLHHLTAPAEKPEVAAMGGFVRGRNGISFQWKARTIDGLGAHSPLDVAQDRATLLHPTKDRAIKTEGTNMAFRRDVLVELGGFDPAYHYFLDETDLNLRLGRAGYATAIVPLAQVHHGMAANVVRHANRVPHDLFEIGASWAVFQRKHLPEGQRADHWRTLRQQQRLRLVHHMVHGGLEPWDVRRKLKRLDAGFAEGAQRAILPTQIARHPAAPFIAFPSARRASHLLRTRPSLFQRDLQKAASRVSNGEIITLLNLSPTALFHKVSFDASGVWVQRGGLFGKSDRSDPLFRMTSRPRRTEKERRRVARLRGFSED